MIANEYTCYGRRFRVEKLPSGKFQLIGRARGFPPYAIDRLGFFDTREAAQSALDRWAMRQGLRPVKRADANAQLALGFNAGDGD